MQTISEYHRPKDIDQALALLARSDVVAVPIGGGSDLVARHRRGVQAVIDLRDLGLSYIRRDGDLLHVGATTTLQALIDSTDFGPVWDGELSRVIECTAARNLREQGTLAGTLVSAEGNNPLATLLLALDASLSIVGRTDKTVSLAEFLPDRSSLLHRSLIAEIGIPLPRAGEAIAFEKVSRTPADLPMVCVAVRARIENGVARAVRIGLGGVGSLPIRVPRVEQVIEGQPIDRISFELTGDDIDPPSDFMGSREYRRATTVTLIRRAIRRVHFHHA
jgi:probable selenate reductase FAD-binding subunit